MQIQKDGYEMLVAELVTRHPTTVEADPVAVANSMVYGVECVDPDTGYTRTHGTEEFMSVTLYPADVVAHSEQPVDVVDRFWNENHGHSIVEESVDVYAIYTMALDLAGALEAGR